MKLLVHIVILDNNKEDVPAK